VSWLQKDRKMNWELLSKYLADECNSQEKETVRTWLEKSEQNRKAFEQIKKIWEISHITAAVEEPDLEEAWNKVNRATGGKIIPINLRQYLKIAASLLIVLSISLYFYAILNTPKQIVVTTQAGEQKEILLADGSQIWLNEKSTLEYPEEFRGEQREVSLTGEGFFNVTRNEKKSFVVNARGSVTKVLGTSFNIREVQSGTIEINVVSGKVAFFKQGIENDKVLLTAGDKASLAMAAEKPVKEINADLNFLAWHTGKLVFKKSTLQDALPVFEQYFRKKIILENKSLNTCLFTSSFDKPSLEDILKTLHAIYGLNYEIRENTIYLKDGAC
jgi:transmembrane sensor